MNYFNMTMKEVMDTLKTNKNGLKIQEVKKRLDKDGKNILVEEHKKSNLLKFFHQFKDLMILILILSSMISFILSLVKKEPFTDSIIILAIVILNAVLGFIQELKADKAIDALKKMQVTKVKVKRNGKLTIIDSEDLVRGDILVLEAGDMVPADARIIHVTSLKVDEASLTGESVPVIKTTRKLKEDTILANRINMVYAGTNVVYGKCEAVVCETGMNTEFGKIAKSLGEEEKEITPLEQKVNDVSKVLSFIIFIIILIMFLIGLLKGMKILEIVMLSISLAVAAIPEGLPAIITITLSLGMSALARKKAVVRKMASVETLGCTEIICSDKTGTITQNKMKVREVFFNNQFMDIEDIKENDLLFTIMALDNDVEKNDTGYIGDPTEIALYECCENLFDIHSMRNLYKRIDEIPFDSERKMMSTIHQQKKDTIILTKGGFDSLILHCSYIYEKGKVKKLTSKKKEYLKEMETILSNKAYRVLAYAYKNIDSKYEIENLEEDLVFVGMSGMIDPPREDVKDAILACKSAHIKPIMITGDSLETAKSIAKEIGILEEDSDAITGSELDLMTAEELMRRVGDYSVYARVSPMNKLAIVNAWKENGKVVAMTGDGVNDAPALKAANIGVGMGITGTEVAKSVSDTILMDDSFSTIVTAVKEGRRIFDNIRNVLVYLLTGNLAEILIVFIACIFGVEIFMPIQLLYINLITDSLPAIALAFESEDENIMTRKARKNNGTFFTPYLISKMTLSSILKTIVVLGLYFINLKLYNVEIANTVAFLGLVLLEMVYAYSSRNIKKSVLNKNLFKNKQLNKSMLFLILVQIIVFATPIRQVFGIVSLNSLQICYTILIVFLVFLIDEFSKNILSKLFKD